MLIKNTFKGFFSIKVLLIIVLIVVAGIWIGQKYFNLNFNINFGSNNTKTKPGLSQNDVKFVTNTLLQKVEGDSYIFYYPVDYTKKADVEPPVIMYENSKSKSPITEWIRFVYSKGDRPIARKTYQECIDFGEQEYRKKADDKITAEVVDTIAGNKSVAGCEIRTASKIPGTDDFSVVINKLVYYENGIDMYAVKAFYLSSAPREITTLLELAIDQFTLK